MNDVARLGLPDRATIPPVEFGWSEPPRYYASDSAVCECGFVFGTPIELSADVFNSWPIVMTGEFLRSELRSRVPSHNDGGRIVFEAPYPVFYARRDGDVFWLRRDGSLLEPGYNPRRCGALTGRQPAEGA